MLIIIAILLFMILCGVWPEGAIWHGSRNSGA
jgi:hypothetical protein